MFSKPGGTVKFIDFGLAVPMQQGVDQDKIIGTPSYMAPEVYKSNYSYACDIWSLGVVIYQVMSGQLPFTGKTNLELIANI